MHKGVIILCEADDREQARARVEAFLENYGEGNVRDRYAIGGRRTGLLSTLSDKFMEEAQKIFKIKEPREDWFVSMQLVKECQPELQELWEKMGGEWPNPHSDHYKLPEEWGLYDIMPLKDCVKIVKNFIGDVEGREKEARDRMIKAKKEEKKKNMGSMSGYYADKYSKIMYRDFSFESNVYDIEAYTGEEIPENTDNMWAVVVDMHN